MAYNFMPRAKNGSEAQSGKRESTYPVFALPEAIKIAEAVKELGGARTPIQRSILAKHFQLAESSPSFFQRVGAAKSFGLIEGHGAYSLTERAKRYFYPTNETDKGLAALESLTAPKAFAVIVGRFDGDKLPKTEMLGNILHREAAVPVSWKDRVVNIFLRSAQHLGVIDQSGILRYGALHYAGGVVPSQDPPPQCPANSQPRLDEVIRQARIDPTPSSEKTRIWSFAEGENVVRVETPARLSMALWQLLEHYVQYLKPEKDGTQPPTNP